VQFFVGCGYFKRNVAGLSQFREAACGDRKIHRLAMAEELASDIAPAIVGGSSSVAAQSA